MSNNEIRIEIYGSQDPQDDLLSCFHEPEDPKEKKKSPFPICKIYQGRLYNVFNDDQIKDFENGKFIFTVQERKLRAECKRWYDDENQQEKL
jgi:hypothetical protein